MTIVTRLAVHYCKQMELQLTNLMTSLRRNHNIKHSLKSSQIIY